MLHSLEEKQIKTVPHIASFNAAIKELGKVRVGEVRAELNFLVDKMDRDNNGSRTFSSSILGSQLSPWPPPLSHLYYVARAFGGEDPDEKKVQDQAALLFGLFVWECIMERKENWVFWDPNLSGHDPNREITGKVYFERI